MDGIQNMEYIDILLKLQSEGKELYGYTNRKFTIEVFGRTGYLDGRLADPDDGRWYPVEELGRVQEFNSEDEAIKYMQAKYPWIGEHKPYSQDPQLEWRIIEEETTRTVRFSNVFRGYYQE